MSDFQENENANYQAEIRQMLTRLKDSLGDRFVRYSEWERGFIESMVVKLEYDVITISTKQHRQIYDLWEKSLK